MDNSKSDFTNFLHDQFEISCGDLELNFSREANERYSQQLFISKGGQKEVYSCYDQVLGRFVAMAHPISSEEEGSKAFIREAVLTSMLEHPSIIPVYDMGTKDERLFYTMKLLSGETLAEQEELPLFSRLDIFLKICEGVEFAHQKGVVHGDLKPQNIFVGKFGEVLIGDWGLATVDFENCDEVLLEEDLFSKIASGKSCKGKIKGTPGYISPACAKGAIPGIQDDIFSMGAIFYFLLTGDDPLAGKTADDAVLTVRQGNIPPVEEVVPEVSSALAAVCNKSMAHSPEERYKNVSEIINDINSFKSGYATVAEKASFLKQLLLIYYRNKTVMNIIAISLIIIIGLTVRFTKSI